MENGIIINGISYEAIEDENTSCDMCDLKKVCEEHTAIICRNLFGEEWSFKLIES